MTNDAYIYRELKGLAAVSAGYPLRRSVDTLAEGNVSMIQLRNANDETGVDWQLVTKVTLPSKKTPNWLQGGDILFAGRGANNFSIALVSPPPRTVCAPQFYVLRIKDKHKISPNFLAWQMNQKTAQDHFKKTAVGSRMMNIRRSAVENLEISVPSIHKQELIVKMHHAAIAEKQVLRALIINREIQMESVAAGLLQESTR